MNTFAQSEISEADSENSEKIFQASSDFIHRSIAGLDVLISVGGNVANFNGYVELNPAAAVLWDALQSPCSVNTLEQLLVDTYQISHEEAREDVSDFLNRLVEHKMVVTK